MKRFITFLLVLLAVAALLRVDFFFTILYFLIAVYLLTRLWAGRVMVSLRVERSFVDRAFHGEEVLVSMTVRNTGRLPIPWLELHESLPVQLVAPPFFRQIASLLPHEGRRFSYRLEGRRRGYYPLGPLRLRSGDVLGIHRIQVLEIAPEYLVVYPQVLPLTHLGLPTQSPLIALPARSPLFEDPSRIIGMRDYQRGDSPRRIHWTATASAGRLLVKQYCPSIARETLICLDMNQASFDEDYRFVAPELAVVTAASLASHVIVQEGLAAGLATEGFDPAQGNCVEFFSPPKAGRGHLMNLLQVLARVEVADTPPLADKVRQQSVRISWGSTIVVITGRESDGLFDSLVCLKRAGFAVALILIQPGRPSADLRQHADLMGIPVHHVWRHEELRAGLGRREAELWR